MNIAENYLTIRKRIPEHVALVLACKKRTVQELKELIAAGATDFGENYVQEAEKHITELGPLARQVRWHMIGALQKNKMNKAIRLFDRVQTVQSPEHAAAMEKRCADTGKKMGVLIEVNIGEETAKAGILPELEAIQTLARRFADFEYLSLEGLMTMGPFWGDAEGLRPYFRKTREIYDRIAALNLPNTRMRYLSMGMSDSYEVAIEEGSNMIRLGTVIFGPRPV
jgi:pyridoxal phosphate enzyme (YggS family)